MLACSLEIFSIVGYIDVIFPFLNLVGRLESKMSMVNEGSWDDNSIESYSEFRCVHESPSVNIDHDLVPASKHGDPSRLNNVDLKVLIVAEGEAGTSIVVKIIECKLKRHVIHGPVSRCLTHTYSLANPHRLYLDLIYVAENLVIEIIALNGN